MPTDTWSSPAGINQLRHMIRGLVPWPSGAHEWQLTATARTLDGMNQLVVTACGDGKTASAYLPYLVLKKLAADPELPRFGSRVPEQPVVLIVTPLSDLGHSQVDEMKKLGIDAVALDVNSIKTASEEGQNLLKKVSDCQSGVVIVSPERLTSPKFDAVLRTAKFRENLALYVVDEAHIVIPWSLTFRKSYGQLGKVIARIRGGVPTLALTATSLVDIEDNMMRCLGVQKYQTIRRSCERPNLQMVFRTLSHGLDGREFPDIAWVTKAHKKTIIYCSTIDLGHRVASYLWRLLPPGDQRFKTVQEYNGLTWAECNAAAMRSFNDDVDALVMVATIKFGMGVDIRNVEVSINLGLPESVEAVLQQNGRAGRNEKIQAHGITYIEPTIVASVATENREAPQGTITEGGVGLKGGVKKKQASKKGEAGPQESEGKTKRGQDVYLRELVRGYVRGDCLVAAFNHLFGSPGFHSHERCFEAQRRLPCSNCLQRPQFLPMINTTASRSSPGQPVVGKLSKGSKPTQDAREQEEFASTHVKLTKDMRQRAVTQIHAFQRQRWPLRRTAKSLYLPSVSLIPSTILSSMMDRLHMLRDRETLAEVMVDWIHLETDGHALFDLIKIMNQEFDEEHLRRRQESAAKAAKTRAANAARKLIEAGNMANMSIPSGAHDEQPEAFPGLPRPPATSLLNTRQFLPLDKENMAASGDCSNAKRDRPHSMMSTKEQVLPIKRPRLMSRN